jgi:toxin ParE1/3/4
VKPAILHRAAQRELDEAAEAYEEEIPGFGLRFYDAVEAAIAGAVRAPRAAPLVPYLPKQHGLRQRTVHRFPYLVIDRDDGERLRVIAIAHGKRRAGYWLRRLRDH